MTERVRSQNVMGHVYLHRDLNYARFKVEAFQNKVLSPFRLGFPCCGRGNGSNCPFVCC